MPMSEERWKEVDDYLARQLVANDPTLEAVLAANQSAGLPAYDVSPLQGKLLYILARAIGARRILEIGTLGGYSTIWLARALGPDGIVVTLEANPHHAQVARENFARAAVLEKVELIVGPALDSLPILEQRQKVEFDLIFIDADKVNTANYLSWSLKLARSGALIITDNVVRNGAITDDQSPDPSVRGVQQFFRSLAAAPSLGATAIQTVGSKGWDGFAIAVVE